MKNKLKIFNIVKNYDGTLGFNIPNTTTVVSTSYGNCTVMQRAIFYSITNAIFSSRQGIHYIEERESGFSDILSNEEYRFLALLELFDIKSYKRFYDIAIKDEQFSNKLLQAILEEDKKEQEKLQEQEDFKNLLHNKCIAYNNFDNLQKVKEISLATTNNYNPLLAREINVCLDNFQDDTRYRDYLVQLCKVLPELMLLCFSKLSNITSIEEIVNYLGIMDIEMITAIENCNIDMSSDIPSPFNAEKEIEVYTIQDNGWFNTSLGKCYKHRGYTYYEISIQDTKGMYLPYTYIVDNEYLTEICRGYNRSSAYEMFNDILDNSSIQSLKSKAQNQFNNHIEYEKTLEKELGYSISGL